MKIRPVMVILSLLLHPVSAWAGELHTSILVKETGDSFACSASNMAPDTLDIEIAIISGGKPPEEIFRTVLTCEPGHTCSIGTSPGDDRGAARCSMFFRGPKRNVRGVLRTFNTRERTEAR
jgi:hypothetical protein